MGEANEFPMRTLFFFLFVSLSLFFYFFSASDVVYLIREGDGARLGKIYTSLELFLILEAARRFLHSESLPSHERAKSEDMSGVCFTPSHSRLLINILVLNGCIMQMRLGEG